MATARNLSVLKAFAVLKSFHSADQWITNSELSRRTNLPEASSYRLIQTLQDIGAIVKGPRGRYRPGMLLVSLSRIVAVPELLSSASHDIAAELSSRLNVTVHVGVLEGGMVHYVTRVATATSFSPHTRIGSKLEAYSSGLGKMLLAALPEEQLENIVLDGELVALTPHTISDPRLLRAALRDVRARGFALDERETREDMCCVAAPVCDHLGHTVAAMSIVDHSERMTGGLADMYLNELRNAAAAMTAKMYPVETH